MAKGTFVATEAAGLQHDAARGEKTRIAGALRAVFAALTVTGAVSAHADQWGLQLGGAASNHNVVKGDVGIVWDPGWTWWHVGGFHFTVVGEGHVAYWSLSQSNAVTPGIWEFGVQPVFRIIKDSGAVRPYFEAGAGLRGLSHARETTDRTMSTGFQFTEVVGFGVQFGQRQNYLVGVRFQHVSNADIKRPNPGTDFVGGYVQYNF